MKREAEVPNPKSTDCPFAVHSPDTLNYPEREPGCSSPPLRAVTVSHYAVHLCLGAMHQHPAHLTMRAFWAKCTWPLRASASPGCMQDNRRRNRRLRCRGLRPPSEMQRFMQQCCAFPLLLRRSLAVLALESGAMEGLCCGSSVPPPRLVERVSRAHAYSQTPKFLPFERFKHLMAEHGRQEFFSTAGNPICLVWCACLTWRGCNDRGGWGCPISLFLFYF